MKRIWLAVVLAVGAAGCAAYRNPVWWKSGVTRAEMQADLREAGAAAESTGRADLDTPLMLGGTTRRQAIIDREMLDRGYCVRASHLAPFAGE